MNLALCRCTQCNYGRKSKWGKFHMKYVRRSSRARTRQQLKTGNYDAVVNRVSVGFIG
jgi:hypothetical protein